MEGYDARTYGERIADIYDKMYDELFDDEAAVARLAGLAREGRVLELAVGTGRIAVPLKKNRSRPGVDSLGTDHAHLELSRHNPEGLHDEDTLTQTVDISTSRSTNGRQGNRTGPAGGQ
jgi:hypothetical protein